MKRLTLGLFLMLPVLLLAASPAPHLDSPWPPKPSLTPFPETHGNPDRPSARLSRQVSISITSNQVQGHAGDFVTFTVVVVNQDTLPARSLNVRLLLRDGLDFFRVASTGYVARYLSSQKTVLAQIPRLNPGERAVVYITARLNTNAASSGSLPAYAELLYRSSFGQEITRSNTLMVKVLGRP